MLFEVAPGVLRVLDTTLFLLHPVLALLYRNENLRVHELLLFSVLVFNIAHEFFEGLEAAMLAHISLVLDHGGTSSFRIFALWLPDLLTRGRVYLIAMHEAIRHGPSRADKILNRLLLPLL